MVGNVYEQRFARKANKGFSIYRRIRLLYNRLTAEQQTHLYAREAYPALFSPQQAENRVNFNCELFDLDANKHTLSELQGRYILLDFWGKGCAPCINALSELGLLAEMYKDKLSIVSISLDANEIWREASKMHPITWYNWSDGKGENGIFAHYGKGGIPLFVLISPDGNILDLWRGYGQGSLIDRLKGVIE